MPDTNWELSGSIDDWLLSDGTNSWLILESIGGTGHGGRSGSKQKQVAPRKGRVLEETQFKLDFVIRPILETQYIQNIKISPEYSMKAPNYSIKPLLFTTFNRKFKIQPMLVPAYTIMYILRAIKNTEFKKKNIIIHPEKKTNFYATLIGKPLHGFGVIVNYLLIEDND